MKTLYPLCFLLCSVSALAQSEVYKDFEVDSAAQPRGGITYLNTYLQTSLRKPLLAEAAGAGGRVIISGIVEPNGHVSNVTVMQSPRPDLGREALRVFSQFNAWQPAKKSGKAVRQSITMPVTFRSNKSFPYVNGSRVNYYDEERKFLPDSNGKVFYKQLMALDTNGIPNGDIIVYHRTWSGWKEDYRVPHVREDVDDQLLTGAVRTRIGYKSPDKMWQGTVYGVNEDGAIVSQTDYDNGRETGLRRNYYPNGALAERHERIENKTTTTSWYPNGQIKQIWLTEGSPMISGSGPPKIFAVWDSLGQQTVKEGKGTAIYSMRVNSRTITSLRTNFTEQGAYVNGFKQGRWTGRYDDASYVYEEEYDQGNCQRGTAWSMNTDTVRYTSAIQPPEFEGGTAKLGQFLSNTLHYPRDAQAARIEGRVFISFVVKADGQLADCEILKGIHPSVDQEALRVVKAMNGKWKPGSQRGEFIDVKYSMPINFTIN